LSSTKLGLAIEYLIVADELNGFGNTDINSLSGRIGDVLSFKIMPVEPCISDMRF